MDLNRTPSQIADATAEEVRALNHRTLDPKAYAQPGDVSDVANAVSALLQRLPQALEQMEAGLGALAGRGAIRMDDGTDVQDRVEAALVWLADTREQVQLASSAMQKATSPLSHMGGLWEDDGTDVEA